MHDTLAFFVMLSETIASRFTLRFSYGSRFWVWIFKCHRLKTFKQKLTCIECVHKWRSKTFDSDKTHRSRLGENWDHEEMLSYKAADVRMRIVIEECWDRGSIETATPASIFDWAFYYVASVTQTVFRSPETKHSLRTRERILFQWRNAFIYKRPMKFLVFKQPHTVCLFCVDISWA